MKTASGILRKKIENNEPLFNIVTNENIAEAINYAKVNGYDNLRIIEQLDRKSCKASIDVRLSAIVADDYLYQFFIEKYIVQNEDIHPGHLVKTFLNLYYRTNGMSGILIILTGFGSNISNVYKYIMEDVFLTNEFIDLTEIIDITNPKTDRYLAKLIELHESSK